MDHDFLSEEFRKQRRMAEVRREGGEALLGIIDQYNADRARRLGVPQSREDAASEPAEASEGVDQGPQDQRTGGEQ